MNVREYHQRYETLMNLELSDHERDIKLATLMSEVETAFNIPMIRKPEWEEENRKVIALYRKISLSREL